MASSFGPLFFERLQDVDAALSHYAGRQVTFHCEDPELLCPQASTHEATRPPEAEAAAVAYAIDLCARYRVAGNVAHLSTRDGLRALLATDPEQRPSVEVTPHHLFFDTDNRSRFRRAELLKMNPPLRSPSDRQALLTAFARGQIDCLATDHAPHTLQEKGSENPPGVPQLDTYGAFLTWLMHEHGLSATRIAEHCCRRPGQWYGGARGALEPGYCGDLAILHMNSAWTVEPQDLQTRCGWSPFEGVTFPGRVAATVAGGQLYRWL